MEEFTVLITVNAGEKLSMRINNSNVVIAVHEGTRRGRARTSQCVNCRDARAYHCVCLPRTGLLVHETRARGWPFVERVGALMSARASECARKHGREGVRGLCAGGAGGCRGTQRGERGRSGRSETTPLKSAPKHPGWI